MMEISFGSDRNGGFGVFDEYNVSNSTDTATPVTKPLILAFCYTRRFQNVHSTVAVQHFNAKTKPNQTERNKQHKAQANAYQ